MKEKSNIILNLILISFVMVLFSCESSKSASELNNLKYSKILNQENKLINNLGIYISTDTLPFFDQKIKSEITRKLIKFNSDRTIQISKDSKFNITNDNLTDFLDSYSTYYYFIKGNSTLIIERYKGQHRKTPFYAWGGPPTKPYKISIKFKIKGDTLYKKKRKMLGISRKDYMKFDDVYMLNPYLTKNHKKITSKFKKASK